MLTSFLTYAGFASFQMLTEKKICKRSLGSKTLFCVDIE